MEYSKQYNILNSLLEKKILFLDGAMGTMIQKHGLDEKDYRKNTFQDHSNLLKGNNEILSLTQSDIIKNIHIDFLEAGATIIETNTFNANSISQLDYNMPEKYVEEMNIASARIASSAVEYQKQRNPKKEYFVAGAIGPTNKTASISPDVNNPAFRNITFLELRDAYLNQARALYKGGIDLFIIETCFDTLNAKAAIFALENLFEEIQKRIPVLISVTITDNSGRTLSGQTVEAFWISVCHADPLVVGINCALGAKEMHPFLEELSTVADPYISCYPNAGLPNAFGEYNQSPEEFGKYIAKFVEDGLINIAGGCCGTTPEFIQSAIEQSSHYNTRKKQNRSIFPTYSGLEPLKITKEKGFIVIGERTNVTGSPKFKKHIANNDLDSALQIAKQQVENGANIIDINFDDALLDSEKFMREFSNLISTEPEICKIPIMIDSSKWSVIEAGLQCLQGHCIVNSISLKEGEEVLKELAKKIKLYGASMVVMAFDEKGQADKEEGKLAICKRAYKILTEEVAIPPQNIIFDPNILTIGTGIPEHNNYAVEFLNVIPKIKKACPHSLVSGGISNLSFSFRGNNFVREAMHSTFLYYAIQNQLDMGIINAGMITVYEDIPSNLLTLVKDLIFNRDPEVTDKLIHFSDSRQKTGSKQKLEKDKLQWRKKPLEKRIEHALVNGIVDYIIEDTKVAYKKYNKALQVIEGPLMQGMKTVGKLFGAGKMFLPRK